MPRCPFATWKPISGSSGSHIGGPFKIVHHTTEGSTAQGAFAAFKSNKSDPHFTVDATTIFQHIDTSEAARALRNPPGGVQTNRDSAVQIEIVGFAHRPKTLATLRNVRKLCQWIERTHNVPTEWPNGPPKPAVNGRDPGGHNRNAATWDARSGHYGHSNVPENTHWDPAYTATEAKFILDRSGGDNLEAIGEYESIVSEDPGLAGDHSRMPDHADPHGAEIESVVVRRRKRPGKRAAAKRKPAATTRTAKRKAGKATAKSASGGRRAAARSRPAAKRRPAKKRPVRAAARKTRPRAKRGRT